MRLVECRYLGQAVDPLVAKEEAPAYEEGSPEPQIVVVEVVVKLRNSVRR